MIYFKNGVYFEKSTHKIDYIMENRTQNLHFNFVKYINNFIIIEY